VNPAGPVHEYVAPSGPPIRLKEDPTQTGPVFAAVAACPHPFAEINKKRPAKRNILVSLNSLMVLIFKGETDLILKIVSEISRSIFKSIQQWETNVKN
jgi:hypothetical protein